MPQRSTSTTTWPLPGSGAGRSTTSSFAFSQATAFMRADDTPPAGPWVDRFSVRQISGWTPYVAACEDRTMRRAALAPLLMLLAFAAPARADLPSLELRWHLDGFDQQALTTPDSSGR